MIASIIESWQAQLLEITSVVTTEFGDLNESQLNYKPSANKWSIGQILEHIIIINSSYYPVVDSVRNGEFKLPWHGKVGFIVKMFGNLILKSVEPQNKRPTQTFPIWEPSTSNVTPDILEKFIKHQEEFSQFIASCQDLLEKGVVVPSPANDKIVYKLEMAFNIIITHEQRHLQQMMEVKSLLADN